MLVFFFACIFREIICFSRFLFMPRIQHGEKKNEVNKMRKDAKTVKTTISLRIGSEHCVNSEPAYWRAWNVWRWSIHQHVLHIVNEPKSIHCANVQWKCATTTIYDFRRVVHWILPFVNFPLTKLDDSGQLHHFHFPTGTQFIHFFLALSLSLHMICWLIFTVRNQITHAANVFWPELA